MSERIYEELRLADGSTVAGEVERARRAAADGDHAQAFELLLELADSAIHAGLPAVAIELLGDLREIVDLRRVPARERLHLLNIRGRLASELEQFDRAREAYELMLERARRLDEAWAESIALQNLGVNANLTGNFDLALRYAERALRVKREIGDQYGAAQIQLNIASTLISATRLDRAERALAEVEPALRELRVPHLWASWHGTRGSLGVARGEHREARAEYLRALRFGRRAGLVEDELIALQNLGAVSNDLGRPDLALGWYERALELVRALTLPVREEILVRSHAVTLHRLGRNKEAREEFLEAKALAELLQQPDRALTSALDAAAVLINLDDAPQARAEIEALLPELRERQADPGRTVAAYANLAAVCGRMGEIGAALAAFDDALAVASSSELGDERMNVARQAAEAALEDVRTRGRGEAYLSIETELAHELLPGAQAAAKEMEAGALLAQAELHELAIEYFSRALSSYARFRDRQMAFLIRNDRALAWAKLGRYAEARRDLRWSLRQAERLGDRVLLQQAEMNLGEIARRQRRLDEAEARTRRALGFARALESPEDEAMILPNLALVLQDRADWEAAERVYAALEELGTTHRKSEWRGTGARGQGDLATAQGRFELAERHFRRAARHDARDPENLRRDLSSLAAALIAAEDQRGLQRTVQRLVDLGQGHGLEVEVSEDLVMLAGRLLQQDQIETATELVAVALLVGATGVGAENEIEPEWDAWFVVVGGVLLRAAWVVAASEHDDEEVWAELARALDRHSPGLSGSAAPLIEQAREVAAELPNPFARPASER